MRAFVRNAMREIEDLSIIDTYREAMRIDPTIGPQPRPIYLNVILIAQVGALEDDEGWDG